MASGGAAQPRTVAVSTNSGPDVSQADRGATPTEVTTVLAVMVELTMAAAPAAPPALVISFRMVAALASFMTFSTASLDVTNSPQ